MMEEFLVVPVSGNPYVLQLEDHDDLLDQAHQIIGCRGVEFVRCGSYIMLIDEVGPVYHPPLPVNGVASTLYPGSDFGDMIHGTAIIGKQGYYAGEPDIVGLAPADLNGLLTSWFQIGVLLW